MKIMKVSVIVPVYGVEPYLNACVESIVAQTYTELEIILVDDGGKDNCPVMCDEWAKKDNRIKVIHKENGGQGTARNAALDIMTGDYVLFVDSDDFIRPDMVKKMIDATDNGKIDGVLCGLTVDNGLRKVNTLWYKESGLYSSKDIIYEYLTSGKIICGPVCKLISSCVLSNIRFPEFRANEDAYIMHEILGRCNSVFVLNDYLYVQLIRQGSTEQSGFNANKMHLLDCEYALRDYIENKYPEYLVYVKNRVADICIVLLNCIYMEKDNSGFIEYESKLRQILSIEVETLDKDSKTFKMVYAYLNDIARYKRMIKYNKTKMLFRSKLKKLIVSIKNGLRGAK